MSLRPIPMGKSMSGQLLSTQTELTGIDILKNFFVLMGERKPLLIYLYLL